MNSDVQGFESAVIRSLRYFLEVTKRGGLTYPEFVIFGMTSVTINEPRILTIYRTEDVDVLLPFLTDVNNIYYTLIELKKQTNEFEIIKSDGILRFFPFLRGMVAIDLTYQIQKEYTQFFKYAYKNAKKKFTKIQETLIYLAKIEDALLCKACTGRPKDVYGLKTAVPELDRLNQINCKYVKEVTQRFGIEDKIKEVFRKAGLQHLKI